MAPIPQIGLGSERDAIEYGPVPLWKQKNELWLPMIADIYLSYRHHPYHRRHTLSNYMLFFGDGLLTRIRYAERRIPSDSHRPPSQTVFR
jgi:hypothetical protein